MICKYCKVKEGANQKTKNKDLLCIHLQGRLHLNLLSTNSFYQKEIKEVVPDKLNKMMIVYKTKL